MDPWKKLGLLNISLSNSDALVEKAAKIIEITKPDVNNEWKPLFIITWHLAWERKIKSLTA